MEAEDSLLDGVTRASTENTTGTSPFSGRDVTHKNLVLIATLLKMGGCKDREYTRAKLMEIAKNLNEDIAILRVAKIAKREIAVLLGIPNDKERSHIQKFKALRIAQVWITGWFAEDCAFEDQLDIKHMNQAMVDLPCIGTQFQPPVPSTEVAAMIAGVESVVERARQESFHARLWEWFAGGNYGCSMSHHNAAACKQERPRYLKHYSITVNVRMDAILSQAGQRSCDTRCNSIDLELVSNQNSHKDVGDI